MNPKKNKGYISDDLLNREVDSISIGYNQSFTFRVFVREKKRRKKMAKLTQAQKDAYIKELEEKLEEADKIQNDQLNILNINQKKKKKHKKITQRTAQAWLLVALVITLLLSAMNMCILSMYMDMFEQAGERFEQILKEGY